jgi:hypothetical protein
VPRDEIVTSVDKDADKKTNEFVLDLTELSFDEITQIDTGVTSGADSSEWDPIDVNEDEKKCSGAGSASASKEGSPAACGVKQAQ